MLIWLFNRFVFSAVGGVFTGALLGLRKGTSTSVVSSAITVGFVGWGLATLSQLWFDHEGRKVEN